MTNSEIVEQFIMVSRDSYKLNQNFSNPLYMDTQNYDYYLKVLALQFSNVVPNVAQTLSTNGTTIVDAGIWDTDQLIQAYNDNSATLGTLSLNGNTGRLKLENTTGSTLTITTDNFLTSDICGFNLSLPYTMAVGATITAAHVVSISDFNFFILSSNNVNGYTMASSNGGAFIPCNAIYVVSSAMDAFAFKTWVSMQPIQFKIESQVLNYLNFELLDGNNKPLNIVPGAYTDFGVVAQIVRTKKL